MTSPFFFFFVCGLLFITAAVMTISSKSWGSAQTAQVAQHVHIVLSFLEWILILWSHGWLACLFSRCCSLSVLMCLWHSTNNISGWPNRINSRCASVHMVILVCKIQLFFSGWLTSLLTEYTGAFCGRIPFV